MKIMRRKDTRIIAYAILQFFILIKIAWAGVGKVLPEAELDTLSPAMQITGPLFQNIFLNSSFIERLNTVDVVLSNEMFKNGEYIGEIEVNFRYDHPGVLNNILQKISSETQIIWFEMSRRDSINTIKLALAAKSEEQIKQAINRLKQIEDRKIYVKKRKITRWVLNLSLTHKEKHLHQITDYLAKEGINVSKFLTPVVAKKGYSNFVFELEIPANINVRTIESNLSFIAEYVDGYMQLSKGQLVDKIFNEYLLEGIDTNIHKKGRHQLLRALKIVGSRHLSESRKDRKTPFIMHQVEVARILVNEIGILSPEVLAYMAGILKANKEGIKIEILLSAILHDAVEDGDISKKQLRKRFGDRVADIVLMLSKEDINKNKRGEAVYLGNLQSRKDMIGIIAQIIKIADRIHNLRTLVDNNQEFQRKIFFYTLDTFMPAFTDKIDFNSIEDGKLREIFKDAGKLLKKQVYETGTDLGLIDKQGQINAEEYEMYELEEQLRQKNLILTIAEGKKILAHGVDETKVGLQGLADIMIQGYIKSRETNFGRISFAGPMRPQKKDERYLDYITESSGDYGPFYIILDPVIEKFRIEHEIDGRKFLIPGFYKAEQIDKDTWGLPYKYHRAYLVPEERDRQFLIGKLKQAVAQSKVDPDYAKQVMAKIITYFEFIQAKKQICLLKVEQPETEPELVSKKVLNLSCQAFIEQGI